MAKAAACKRGRRHAFKVGTAKPVNFLLGGQEVDEINAIESSRRMRGRDGSGGGGGAAGRAAGASIGRGSAGSPLTNRTRRPPGPSISPAIRQ